ncbi:DUF1365 domain-containing protein [Streptosporangiaceae bacterium NEAU-GS5]|nr:DUF1365 domain-containing protein [Streptosporangiaceae bacterium NEAU-GS5]
MVTAAALYESTITHVRAAPVRNVFRYRSCLWLADLDALPRRLRGVGDRADLDRYLAGHGLAADRILMLAHAKTFGYVFNPLTVFWCLREGGLICAVAEVRNTYGGAHRHLLEPGRNETPKELYVSPFNKVEGFYRLSLPIPDERLALTVTLHRDGHPPFAASVRGRRVPYGRAGRIRMAARYPLAPMVTRLRIQRQGVGLYLRGLRVVSREAGR